MTASPAPARADLLGKTIPWLLLLPGLCLAWPGSGNPLIGDPYPHLAGAGVIALACVPLALLLLVRGAMLPLPGFPILALIGFLASLAVLLGDLTDPFEARRALVLGCALLILFVGGAQLDARGRVVFNRGLIALSIAWTAFALPAAWNDGGQLAGVLGNTGPLSQAALPGAVVGAWYVTTRRGLWFGLSILAVGLFVTHAAAAPVLASALAFLVTLFASRALSPWPRRYRALRRRFAILGALTVFAVIAFRGVGSYDTDMGTSAPAASAPAATLGGVEVRARIWSRVPAILLDEPLGGLGPGQFQAGFPPYRDPVELALSGSAGRIQTEVEHAHNDWLQGLAELGPVGGSFWILFLVVTLRACVRVLRGKDLPLAAQAAAGLALCVNALFHCPLTVQPASAALAFVLFGGVHRAVATKPLRYVRWNAIGARAAAAALLVAGLFGLPLVRHGAALADYTNAVERVERSLRASGGTVNLADPELAQAAADTQTAIDRALAVAPAAAPARFLAARQSEGEDRSAAWKRALLVRPHSFEALYQLGVGHARHGEFVAARAYLQQARTYTTGEHGPLLRSLARLELLAGDLEAGLALVRQLEGADDWDAAWGEELAVELVLQGRTRAGLALWPRLDPSSDTTAAWFYANGQAAEDAGQEDRARALTTLAHLLWAREHIARDDPATAVRSYRQALRPTHARVSGGAPSVRFELAAAELLCDRDDDARRSVGQLVLNARIRAELPAWARRALIAAGLGE